MKNIFLPVFALFFLFTFVSCEELGFDIRKVELVIEGEVESIELFDTYNVDYAVIWYGADILSYFDISAEAEILNFWVKDLKVYYQPCDVIEAEKLDLEIYVSEPQGAITLLALAKNKDLKNLSASVDPQKPFSLDIEKAPGGVTILNQLLGFMIQDDSRFLNIIVDGVHTPANALVCGAILIELDVYIKYKECRLVPFGSDAGELCD